MSRTRIAASVVLTLVVSAVLMAVLVTASDDTPTPTPTDVVSTPPKRIPYGNCDEAPGPIQPVDPRWNPDLDRDHDGVACE